MRWIKIPEDITYRDDVTDEIIKFDGRESTSFLTWFLTVVLRDTVFGKGVEAFDARAELLDAVKKYQPNGPAGDVTRPIKAGDIVPLPTEGLKRVKEALQAPNPPWHAIAGAAFRPFVKALMDDKDSAAGFLKAPPKIVDPTVVE